MAGQSNVRGYASLGKLPDGYENFDTCFIWTENEFEQIVPGTTKISHFPSQFGPELSFCKYMEANTQDNIYIVKYWYDGGGLDSKSSDVTFSSSKVDTFHSRFAFVKLNKTIANAIDGLKKRNIEFELAGYIWIHGEQDGKDVGTAERYPQNLLVLMDELNARFEIKNTKIILTQPLPNPKSIEAFPARIEMILSMKTSAEVLRQSGYDVELISTEGISTLSDNLHYNSSGQLQLGTKIAKTFVNEANK